MSPRRFRKLRVIVLMQEELMPPETLDGVEDKRSQPWRTEYDVVSTLRAMGHEAWPIGVGSELGIDPSRRFTITNRTSHSICWKSLTGIPCLTSMWSAISS